MGKILNFVVLLATAASLAFTAGSCNTSGCTELKSATPRADFYSAVSGNALRLDSLSVIGIGVPGDSLLLAPGEKETSVYLPMPPRADTVSWELGYHWAATRGVTDTVTIAYERQPWFAGEECGAMYRYKIRRVDYTRNLIDSIGVPDSLVTNVDLPTLNIYFLIDTRQ